MPGVTRLRRLQFGQEATAGTPVIATAIYRGTGVLEDAFTITHPEEHVGYLAPVDRSYIPKKEATLDLPSAPATFEQILYPLAAGIKNVVTGVADGGGGSGKIYAYPLPTTSPNTIKTFSIEGGDNQQMEKGDYAFVEEITIDGKPGEALSISSKWRMREVGINAYTAGTIAFVASSHKITDSANGLARFKTGMRITVSGTVNNNGTFTVVAGGVAGEIVVSETLVNEESGSSFTIEQTFTSIALPTVEEILFQKGKLYIDAVGGTLGATQKSNTFLGMQVKITTGWAAVFTGDGNLYYSFIKNVNPGMTVDITFEHDGSATAEKAFARNRTSRQIRLLFEGSALAAPGTGYTYKSLIIDAAGTWDKFTPLDEQNGNDIVKGSFRAAFNSTANLFAVITVVNELASLI